MEQRTEDNAMNEFATYHPVVNLVYFVFVIGFGMFLMNPVCLGISFASAFVYSVMLKGKRAIKSTLLYMLPMMLAMAVMNPAFNHAGATVLAYLPGGNPLTLESVLYGVSAAWMIASVICWFSCYNEVMTSDKFIYLFGKVMPSLSLILSMTLRFVPRFAAQLGVVTNAQKCIGRDVSHGSIIQRAKHGVAILSIMITWALENAIETADSMKSRGYGHGSRTAFSIFTFDNRDRKALVCITALGVYTLVGSLWGGMYFRYFPSIKSAGLSAWGISCFVAYAMLCVCPIAIELWEAKRWKALQSKI